MLQITDTLHTSADGRACWVLHLHGTLGGIAVAIIVVVRGVGTSLNTTFTTVKDNLN